MNDDHEWTDNPLRIGIHQCETMVDRESGRVALTLVRIGPVNEDGSPDESLSFGDRGMPWIAARVPADESEPIAWAAPTVDETGDDDNPRITLGIDWITDEIVAHDAACDDQSNTYEWLARSAARLSAAHAVEQWLTETDEGKASALNATPIDSSDLENL